MTNPTPHGQVPEALIDLIDAYAETRHRYGRIHNARTEAARNAVIEALSGVQALSAAPANPLTISPLEEQQMFDDWCPYRGNPDPRTVWAAAIEAVNGMQLCAASPTPPAEQPIDELVVTKTRDGQIVSVTRQDDEGRILSVIATCDPEEQQAEESRVKLLAECRDAFPIPEPSSPLEVQWAAAMARPEDVLEYVRLCVAAMQAAPKAAPGEPFQHRVQPWLLQCFGAEIAADTVERNHRFLEEALELVQSTGCTQSEAHQLVDYVFGRPVGDPAQEVGGVMVTLAALCLASGLDMHNAGEAELARIWTKVEAIRAKQAAKPKHSPLPQVAPQPAPAPLSDDVVKDAARWRWLRANWFTMTSSYDQQRITFKVGEPRWSDITEEKLDAAIDAAIAAQGGK